MWFKSALFIVGSATLAVAAPAQGSQGSGAAASNYPPESMKLREEGTVGYRVELYSDGSLRSCEVTRSSGFPRLDKATCEMIVRNARFKRGLKTYDGNVVWKIS